MPLVIIEGPGIDPMRIDAVEGGALADLCDDVGAPVPFSCRSANCGTCRIVVLEGADQLEGADDEELDVLDVFGNVPPGFRLACCAKMLSGSGVLRLRPVTDDE